MSGHSKWHNIQKTKGAQDAKRAQAFTKIAREMIVAVKEGGSGDPANNSRLAAVIAKKKGAVDIVTGFPKERSSHFVSALHTLVPDIQISMVDVDDNGKIYRMIPQDAQQHYEMVGAQGT